MIIQIKSARYIITRLFTELLCI